MQKMADVHFMYDRANGNALEALVCLKFSKKIKISQNSSFADLRLLKLFNFETYIPLKYFILFSGHPVYRIFDDT